MSKKKLFNWEHLDKLRKFTDISDYDHQIRDTSEIYEKLQQSRVKWKVCKTHSAEIRRKFISERAELLALKLHTTEEKVIK
jgi:hypothetical protein